MRDKWSPDHHRVAVNRHAVAEKVAGLAGATGPAAQVDDLRYA